MRAFAAVRTIFFSFLTLVSFTVLCVGGLIGSNPAADLSQDGNAIPLVPADPTGLFNMITPGAKGLAVATSVITLLIIVPHLFFNCLVKKRAWTKFLKRVWLELCWTAMLSVLWLASATVVSLFSKFTTLGNTPSFGLYCGNCWEVLLLNASTWIAWGATFGYFVALFGCFLASLPQGGKLSLTMITDEILNPQGNEPDVELIPSPSSAHPAQQSYLPTFYQPSPTQGHMPQRYSFQPPPQPNGSNPPDTVDVERPIPLHEGVPSQ